MVQIIQSLLNVQNQPDRCPYHSTSHYSWFLLQIWKRLHELTMAGLKNKWINKIKWREMVELAQSQSRRFIFTAGLSSRQLYCSRNTSAVQMISFGQIQAVWQMIPLQIICKNHLLTRQRHLLSTDVLWSAGTDAVKRESFCLWLQKCFKKTKKTNCS